MQKGGHLKIITKLTILKGLITNLCWKCSKSKVKVTICSIVVVRTKSTNELKKVRKRFEQQSLSTRLKSVKGVVILLIRIAKDCSGK